MKKRLLSALLVLCIMTMLLTAVFAAGSSSAYSDSGSTSMTKLTKQEIARLMELTQLSDPTQIYGTAPGISDPYSAGSLRQDVLQAGLDRLNALRRIAGLPAVSLDASYSASTQAAALVNAVNRALSHSPAQPSDMSDDLYRQGAAGARSSNIAYYYGYRPADGPLGLSVDMWMDDSDAGNVSALGHRRWQLNPAMGKTGFGAVYASNGSLYSAEYAHDRSVLGVNYDFIAWPASGNFPAVDRLFHADTAWSVTLNPNDYQVPSKSDLTVTLTRESDGYSWTFSGSESYAASGSGKYFNVDTGGYGVSNCIIFRPDGVSRYEGVYTVTITGLRTWSGGEPTLSYQVDFFDPDNIADPGPVPTEPDPTEPEPEESKTPETSFTDVPAGEYYADAVAWAVEKGITNGYPGSIFAPGEVCTRAQIVTFLWRAYGEPKPVSGVNPFTDVKPGDYFYDAVLWAYENNITTGASASVFDPNGKCTRDQAVTFQWRAAGRPAADGGSSFTDVVPGSYYADAVAWAVDKGVTNGYPGNLFAPGEVCIRAQIVTFLYREMGK